MNTIKPFTDAELREWKEISKGLGDDDTLRLIARIEADADTLRRVRELATRFVSTNIGSTLFYEKLIRILDGDK